MKLLLLAALFVAGISTSLAQCLIDSSIQSPGFHPDTGSYLPKACAGSNYDATIQIYAPQNVTIALGTFPVNYVQLDSIPDLPISMGYSTNPAGGKMFGGERGCINIHGTVNFSPGDYHFNIYYTANFTAFGGPISLGFLAPYKLHVDTGSATFHSISDTVCQSPGYNLGGQWITAPGTYSDTLMSSSGCDSIVTLQLSVVPFSLNVAVNGNTLHAVPGMESYQWFNCDIQDIVTGATDSVFTPATAGSYSVVINNRECSGVSECVSYTGIEQIPLRTISVFPNPGKGSITLQLPQIEGEGVISLISVSGELMFSGNTTGQNLQLHLPPLPKGMYVLQCATMKTTYTGKVVVQ